MSNQQETKRLKNNKSELVIKFEELKVSNVIVMLIRGPIEVRNFDLKAHAVSKGYAKIYVSKTCSDLIITALESENEKEIPNGETFIPLNNIWRIAVDYLPGTKRQG
jgi:hypothetical protein